MELKTMIDLVKSEVETILASIEINNIDFTGKTVLVTGGAGFLGSWVCDVLIGLNARVICVDNFASGFESNISHLKPNKNFQLRVWDVSRPVYFDEEHLDIVLHMASRADPFMFPTYPIQILKANTLGTWVALGIARRHRARMIYASTSEIYGNPPDSFIPTPECYNGNVNPVGMRSCYDEAKRAGEAFVKAYQLEHGLDTVILRIFNTYGPRMRPGTVYGRVIPIFIHQALEGKSITIFGDGQQTRSFIYITDEIEAIVRAVAFSKTSGMVLNIGNDVEVSISELATMIQEIVGSSVPIEYHTLPEDDPRHRCPNIELAKQHLDWHPKIHLREGLKKMLDWMRGDKERL